MSKHIVDMYAKRDYREGEQLFFIRIEVGALFLNFRLTDADRLNLISFLTGGANSAHVPLVGISPLTLPTSGAKVVEVTPELLNVRKVEGGDK